MNESPNYYFLLGEERIGPVGEAELRSMLLDGRLERHTPCWFYGQEDWMPLETALPQFATHLPPRPPALPPAETPSFSIHTSEQTDSNFRSDSTTLPIYFYIPIKQFIALSLFSLGLYWFYWMYKNWEYIKERDNSKVSSFWRALFNQLFFHSLLTNLQQDERLKSIRQAPFNITYLYLGWLALWLFVLLASEGVIFSLFGVSGMSIVMASNDLSDSSPWLVCGLVMAGALALLTRVQIYVNEVNKIVGAPHDTHSIFSPGHVLVYILSIFWWWMVLVVIQNS